MMEVSKLEQNETAQGAQGDACPELERAEVEKFGGLSANTLKLIAIIAMTIDHIAAYFMQQGEPLAIAMRFVGRITGPTMFFMVAQGYRHTRDVNRYTLRLLVFAVVSYLPFVYVKSGAILPTQESWMNLNVIYTIFIGLLAIRVRNEWKNPVLQVVAILALLFLSMPGDWGELGLLMMLGFDLFYGNFKYQAIAYCTLVLTYGNVLYYMLYPWQNLVYNLNRDNSILIPYLSSYGMFLPILLLAFYNGKKGQGGVVAKWGFYIYYPLHLLVMALIKFKWMA